MEENRTLDESIVAMSMEIIVNAGDARLHVSEALQEISLANFELANEKLEIAQKEIRLAHAAQTDALQKEAGGEAIGYSILFAHAQDTLMTINSELNVAKQLIKVFKAYDERISRLEAKMGEI